MSFDASSSHFGCRESLAQKQAISWQEKYVVFPHEKSRKMSDITWHKSEGSLVSAGEFVV